MSSVRCPRPTSCASSSAPFTTSRAGSAPGRSRRIPTPCPSSRASRTAMRAAPSTFSSWPSSSKEAYHFLGSPEGELALAQATCYLALAPKSNAVYAAWNEVAQDIQDKPAEPVPLHLRNAPTGLMANQGYGKGYQYAHDAPEARVNQEHLPAVLSGRVYYRPTDRGLEKELRARLEAWRRWREEQTRR